MIYGSIDLLDPGSTVSRLHGSSRKNFSTLVSLELACYRGSGELDPPVGQDHAHDQQWSCLFSSVSLFSAATYRRNGVAAPDEAAKTPDDVPSLLGIDVCWSTL